MWNTTIRMSECIAEGITSNNKEVTVKIINSVKIDKMTLRLITEKLKNLDLK